MAVIDWYSRYVLSWELSVSMEASFCLSALDWALQAKRRPEIFDTDQGAQFTSMEFVPDDVLWELPFQALKDSSGRYLVETHPVFYAPSLTALREMTKRHYDAPVSDEPKPAVTRSYSPGPSLLAFGDPILSVAQSAA